MKQHATLVLLAAGLGSRFGGSKQISNVGPHGEFLMEYAVYDAIDAGFDHIVFILKEEMIATVRERFAGKYPGVRFDYAVQDATTVPSFYRMPPERTKPLGTVHAVLAAAAYLDSPFATVNSDDYYGKTAYRLLAEMLSELKDARDAAMVPYILGNTMSENGGVTRGICTVEDGKLLRVEETGNIRYGEDRQIVAGERRLDPATLVSMNIWGFHPDFVPVMQTYFERFLRGLAPQELKAECLLPVMVNDLLAEGRLKVRAVNSPDRWFGITYREDRETVMNELEQLHRAGEYPAVLDLPRTAE